MIQTALRVRALKAAHVFRVSRLDARAFASNWSAEYLTAMLLRPNCGAAVVQIEDDPSGIVLGYVVWKAHRRELIVERLAVQPACRRQGVGTALLGRVISKLKGDRRRLVIDVPERDVEAQLWLRSNQIPAVKCIPDYYGPDAGAIRFRLVKEGDTDGR